MLIHFNIYYIMFNIIYLWLYNLLSSFLHLFICLFTHSIWMPPDSNWLGDVDFSILWKTYAKGHKNSHPLLIGGLVPFFQCGGENELMYGCRIPSSWTKCFVERYGCCSQMFHWDGSWKILNTQFKKEKKFSRCLERW